MLLPTMSIGTYLSGSIIFVFQFCVLPELFDCKISGAGMVCLVLCVAQPL